MNSNSSRCEFCNIGQTDSKSQIIYPKDPKRSKCFIGNNGQLFYSFWSIVTVSGKDTDLKKVRDIRPAAMHHLLVIPKHHVANILVSDVDTVKQLENAAFDFLESDPDAQEHGASSILSNNNDTYNLYDINVKLT